MVSEGQMNKWKDRISKAHRDTDDLKYRIKSAVQSIADEVEAADTPETLKTEAVAVLKVWLSITDQFDVRYIASQIPYGTAMLVRLLCVSQTST